MAEFSNEPIWNIMPPLAEESKPLFAVVMVIFIAAFYIGIHYRMHVARHGFPPFYVIKVQNCLRRLFS